MSSVVHFFKSVNYSTTEKIIPKFKSWEGLKIAEKVSEFVKDLLKTLCCITLVGPLLTLCYDLIARKPIPVTTSLTGVPENTNSRPHSFWYGQVLVTAVTTSVFYVTKQALLNLGSEGYLPLAIVGTACVIPALAGIHKYIYPIFTM